MNWYVAEAVYESGLEHSGSKYSPLIDRTWFLVSAEDEPSAEAKADVLARSKEHSYANEKGQLVKWTFVRLVEVTEMIDQRFEDGAELKSTMSDLHATARCVGIVVRPDRRGSPRHPYLT